MLPAQLVEEMYAHAKAALPNECCGLLAGQVESGGVGRVERRYPLSNAAASPVEYNAEPRELLAASRDMRARGLVELAVYHSHPTSEPVPSHKDLARNRVDEIVLRDFHLIISLKDGDPVMRAWRLTVDAFTEVEWAVEGA
jgi:proteasome lid subunit RPN8/RPN11